ncbi:MAG: McrC family protein, partial [Donghicola eburneus]
LNAAHRLFPGEVKGLRIADLDITQATVQSGKLAGGREYYFRALDIAALILSERSISFDHFGEDIELGTFVVNFETLFEDYLRNSLRQNCTKEVFVLDGNGSGKKPLFDDRDSPPAQPDIVLRNRGGDQSLVVEVKYKEKPNRSDINQAITYANSYKTRKVVLLHQSSAAGQKGLRHLGTINGVRLFGYAFDLGSKDLETEEKKMASAFDNMLLEPDQGNLSSETELVA